MRLGPGFHHVSYRHRLAKLATARALDSALAWRARSCPTTVRTAPAAATGQCRRKTQLRCKHARRTTVEIDDELLTRAQEVLGHDTIRAAVEDAGGWMLDNTAAAPATQPSRAGGPCLRAG